MSESVKVAEIAVERFRAKGAAAGRGPCVVLGHGFGGTVSSGLAGFAEAFADAGYEALAFDYRGFGMSGGEPRGVVSAAAQLVDYEAVVAYARSLPEVDPDRVIGWGVSFSGGLMFPLAAADSRLAGAVALSPATDGFAVVLNVLRREGPWPLLRLSAAGVRDQLNVWRGRPRVMAQIVAEPGHAAALNAPGALAAYEGIAGPDWRNEVAANVFLTLALHRPGRRAGRIGCPLLVQVGDRDQSVPAERSVRDGVRGHAVIRHYPCDHFDSFPGGSVHAEVLADQLAFLARVTAPRPSRATVAA